MSRYPKECPVFEVVEGPSRDDWKGFAVPKGAHVEGVGTSSAVILIRVVAAEDRGDLYGEYREFYPHIVRPLTQAAREMLALVQAAGSEAA